MTYSCIVEHNQESNITLIEHNQVEHPNVPQHNSCFVPQIFILTNSSYKINLTLPNLILPNLT